MHQEVILPPQCIGILGGGQLGMLLAQTARSLGYKVAILEPELAAPAAKYADWHIVTAYTDPLGLNQLAKLAAVVTTEFENVPAEALALLAQQLPVYPAANAILIAQNRIKEKTFFHDCGLATADFTIIRNLSDCARINANFFPAILKTATLGYDGKGQINLANLSQLRSAFQQLGQVECILEQRIQLKQEVSLIAARNQHGISYFPLINNQHRNGILDVSTIPALAPEHINELAKNAAEAMLSKLNYYGILTIEFFIDHNDQLLVNEIAPRPHNSGHITIEAAVSSQFEQQLRAICGLPFGSTQLKQAGAMLNLLGDIWLDPQTTPFVSLLTQLPDAKLHWYGKTTAKPGRKMGHICLTANSRELLLKQIKELKHHLKIS